MCRHCERLIEDIEHKDLVHRFMQVTAEKCNRTLKECGCPHRVTADDIDITVELTARDWSPNAFADKLPEIIRMLDEMHK